MFLGVILCGGKTGDFFMFRLRAFPNPENAFLSLIQGKKLGFWNCEKWRISFQKLNFSLNQGQGIIVRVRECAQSIHRIKLFLDGSILEQYIFGSQKITKIHFLAHPVYKRYFYFCNIRCENKFLEFYCFGNNKFLFDFKI